MTKSSSGRRARAESGRSLAIAQRLLGAGKYKDAIEPLLESARMALADAGIRNDLGVAYLATRRFSDAVTWLERSIALQPDVGVTHYNLGLALQHLGHDEAAILEYRDAVALSPELAGAHAQLADLLWDKGMRSEAVSAYEQAYAAAPASTLGRLCKVKALSAANQTREAERALRELIASDPSSSMAHVLLGRLLQETGRFDEAIASFEQAVKVDPWQTNGYQGVASARRITDADRPWVTALVSRIEAKDWDQRFAPTVANRHRMMLHFAAGKAFDDLGDYAEAMSHFHAANRIRGELYRLDLRELEQRVGRLVARFTPELFSRHAALGSDDETPVLIVGMPRSGTTLLERILSSHSRVRGCGELDFWNERGPVWANAEPERLGTAAAQLRTDYLAVLRGDASDKPQAARATDKMPFNFFWVGLVHLLFPRARIVSSRRNPLDTCLSLYTTGFTADWGFASTTGDLASYYRLYERLMHHWRTVIPSDRLLDVDYEDVVAKPEETARRLIAFVGLDWESACLRPDTNEDAVRTASNWQARQPIYQSSVARWRRYEPWISELRELL
jgi:tetratricopeptide (TPR) repeat protein